jgi:hypothetical protein
MILEEFGPTIHHLAGADNVVADALSRLLSNRLESTEGPSSVPDGADETKEMFATTRREAEDTTFPLAKYKIQNAQTKELNKKNSDLKRFLSDPESRSSDALSLTGIHEFSEDVFGSPYVRRGEVAVLDQPVTQHEHQAVWVHIANIPY